MVRVINIYFLILLMLCCKAYALDKVKLTNGEWAPYLSEHLPNYGTASHIVKEAFEAVGVQVQYGFYPWKRSYKLAREGTWNGTLVWVYTEDRAADFMYSDVVISEVEYLFHLKDKPLIWKKIDDLRGLTIGATLHTVYPTLEEAAHDGILKIERAGNYDNLYRRLLNHRIDAIPQVSQVAKHYLRTTLPPRERDLITYSDTILQKRNYHLILSKRRPESKSLIGLFNKGLSLIRKNGRYQKIIENLERGSLTRNLD